jgi:restriction system protein
MWMIRGPRGRDAQQLLERGVIGLGWGHAAPRPQDAGTPREFYAAVRKSCPQLGHLQVLSAGRQLYTFFHEMKIGDAVMTYDPTRRTYHVGIITGDAASDAESASQPANVRTVEWRHSVERDRLSTASRASLRSRLTLFQPSRQAVQEIERLIGNPSLVPAADTETADGANDALADAPALARELLRNRLVQLTWQEMQALVAGILRAMGYKTRISLPGGDRGKDIMASPDGLGLEQPRIFVEVKHQKRPPISAPDIRKFIGGRHAHNDRCLFVSTSGFSLEGRYEAERSAVPLTLVDGDDLIDLLLEHYERMDAETRALVPLRKIYWPLQTEAGSTAPGGHRSPPGERHHTCFSGDGPKRS